MFLFLKEFISLAREHSAMTGSAMSEPSIPIPTSSSRKLINNDFVQIGDAIVGETSGDNSGGSISFSADGDTVAIGAPDNDGNRWSSGHVRVYRLDANQA